MFFQSVYAQVEFAGVNSVSFELFTNRNALSTSYLGSTVYATGNTPFDVVPRYVEVDTTNS